jgi:hypothetical protein
MKTQKPEKTRKKAPKTTEKLKKVYYFLVF